MMTTAWSWVWGEGVVCTVGKGGVTSPPPPDTGRAEVTARDAGRGRT